ncbi:hypothetical protein HK102_002766 [Quaeritorhiza haematococci]|nr:hypothetical protein HK102_002766 [Quaeritorhiza haematococci]
MLRILYRDCRGEADTFQLSEECSISNPDVISAIFWRAIAAGKLSPSQKRDNIANQMRKAQNEKEIPQSVNIYRISSADRVYPGEGLCEAGTDQKGAELIYSGRCLSHELLSRRNTPSHSLKASYDLIYPRSDSVYVYDFGSELYIWSGAASSFEDQGAATQFAESLKRMPQSTMTLNSINNPLTSHAGSVAPENLIARPKWAFLETIHEEDEPTIFNLRIARRNSVQFCFNSFPC